jgi:hypothetical protein
MKCASVASKGLIAKNSAISALAQALLSRVWEGCVANKRVSAHPSLRLGARKSAICALAERRGETDRGLRRRQRSREARTQGEIALGRGSVPGVEAEYHVTTHHSMELLTRQVIL